MNSSCITQLILQTGLFAISIEAKTSLMLRETPGKLHLQYPERSANRCLYF